MAFCHRPLGGPGLPRGSSPPAVPGAPRGSGAWGSVAPLPGQPGPAPPCCPFTVPCLSGGLGLSFGKGFRGIFKTAKRDGIRSGIVCFLGRRPSGNCTWRVTGAVCGFLTFSPVRFHAEGAPSSLTLTLPRRLQGHFGGGGQKCFPKERLASFCRLAEEVGVGGARTPARSWAPRFPVPTLL